MVEFRKTPPSPSRGRNFRFGGNSRGGHIVKLEAREPGGLWPEAEVRGRAAVALVVSGRRFEPPMPFASLTRDLLQSVMGKSMTEEDFSMLLVQQAQALD